IRQQHEHHAERLAEVVEACAEPLSAADVVPVLFHRKLDLHQLTFAMGEALAHLHALYFEGRLTRSMGADGIYPVTAAGSAAAGAHRCESSSLSARPMNTMPAIRLSQIWAAGERCRRSPTAPENTAMALKTSSAASMKRIPSISICMPMEPRAGEAN